VGYYLKVYVHGLTFSILLSLTQHKHKLHHTSEDKEVKQMVRLLINATDALLYIIPNRYCIYANPQKSQVITFSGWIPTNCAIIMADRHICIIGKECEYLSVSFNCESGLTDLSKRKRATLIGVFTYKKIEA